MSKLFERTLGLYLPHFCSFVISFIEAATDQVVVDTDWSGIMECIDMVRGKDVRYVPSLFRT